MSADVKSLVGSPRGVADQMIALFRDVPRGRVVCLDLVDPARVTLYCVYDGLVESATKGGVPVPAVRR